MVGYIEDPELGDQNDPEYNIEIFKTMKEMGWGPEMIRDPNEREAYKAWLDQS